MNRSPSSSEHPFPFLFSLRWLVAYWVLVTAAAGLIVAFAFEEVTVSSEMLLGLYLILLFLPVLYPVMMRILPRITELTVGDIKIRFDRIEEKIEEQRERVEQISNSQQNSLHSLSSLVIADPLEIPSYRKLVDRRVYERGELLVGSQEYTESVFLCALIAELLGREAKRTPDAGFETVTPRYNFGEANLNFIALTRGDVDLYPGYTWQGFEMIYASSLSGSARELSELGPEAAVARLNELYSKLEHPLTWLAPTGIENNFVIVVGSETARKKGLRTIADLRGHQHELTVGCDPDFFGRPNGFRLLSAGDPVGYGLSFQQKKFYDHEEIYDAHREGEIDVLNGYSTDPALATGAYEVLEDDRGLFGTFYSSWVVRTEVLTRYPRIGAVLSEVGGRLRNEDVVEVIRRVDRRVGRRARRREIKRAAGELADALGRETPDLA